MPKSGSISNTRQIGTHQGLRLRTGRGNYLLTHIIENGENFLVLSFPEDRQQDLEVGETLEVYFWRENDRGYRFHSRVIASLKQPMPMLLLEHAQRLDIVETAQCILAQVYIPFSFYAIDLPGQDKTLETVPISHQNGVIIELGDREFQWIIPPKASSNVSFIGHGSLIKGNFVLPSHDGVEKQIIEFIAKIQQNAIPRLGVDNPNIVARIMQQPEFDPEYWLGFQAKFANISDRCRHRILDFIYAIEN